MSEKPEEQLDQSDVEGQGPTDEAAPQQDSPAPSTTDDASQGPSPAGELPVESQAPDTEAAPAVPEADASATVPDAPAAEATAEEGAPDESTSEENATPEESTAQEPAASPAPPKPKKKKRETDPAKVKPIEEIPEEELEEPENLDRDWYILKVQSNREKSIRDALERRMKVAGLERFFGDIIVPTEDIAEYKNGKRKISKRKLWPGYIVVNMAINDDTWFLVRETPGIGDFTGSIGKPTPMLPDEVERIKPKEPDEIDPDEPPVKIGIRFKPGDRVRVKDGYFQNFEGDVESIDEGNGRVTVICSIFGRSTPVELEHWQVEDV